VRTPLLILLLASSAALAEQCDCQKIVGQCSGAIDFIKSYGSKPSFGAEIVVHSSEKVCSKVEYYVDGTPHQTLLVNRSQEPESLFGTRPITQKSVTYRSCQICANVDPNKGAAKNGDAKQPPANDFAGTWTGSGRNSFGFSQDMTVTVTPTGNNQYQISQVHIAGGTATHGNGSGAANGKVLSYPVDGGTINCSLTLISATSLVKKCSGWLTTNEATLTKQ
jgi:hypothetical protein